ncbi:MAG: TetR family transcriptional regulator [candidate division Zixibacteria bacterium]|nr:TetR family transcriptional regulator [candidate division Zixibacteria bacterium]
MNKVKIKSREADKTRWSILKAAFQEIQRNGFRSTGINDILANTDVTKGAFYHHFSTKNELGHALVLEILTWMVDEIWLKPLEKFDNPIDGIQKIITAIKMDNASIALGCPLNNMAVEMAGVDDDFRERIRTVYDRWIEGYALALKKGQLDRKVTEDVDAEEAAAFIVSAMAGCRGVAKAYQNRKSLLKSINQLNRYLETLRA